jgi:putative SOS response-associated peptidase YedK
VSRLHTVRSSAADIAAAFGAEAVDGLVVPEQTLEGWPGLVVVERDGRRILREMTWGFPRMTQEKAIRGEDPDRVGMVANLTSPMWNRIVTKPAFRCLIPITHFANPDGDAGAKTRTWFSVKDRPIVAWAGFCREGLDGEAVYAGMTMDANEAIPPTNDRMPVLLDPEEHRLWLHGDIQDVIRFQFRPPFAASRFRVQRTDDSWRGVAPPPGTEPQLALF